MPPNPRRVVAERHGRRAELLAAWYLRLKGYRIVAMRHRVPVGEIDLIARRGRVVAFVEVKARQTLAEAMEAVTPTGRRRIARAAEAWLATNPAAGGYDLRFDVVAVVPWRPPVHLAGVFDAEGGA